MMDLIFFTATIWFLYFLVNHAEMFSRLRQAAMPALPKWISYVLQCSVCFSFWLLAALSLFTGWTPLLLVCPPFVMMFDLSYRRLKGDK